MKNSQEISNRRKSEAGFTLAEALMATLILVFGLASIFNLMIVAITSNSVANRASGATVIASGRMEALRSTAFSALVDSPADSLEVRAPGYFQTTTIEGVGTFESRWLIQTLTDTNLKFIQVRTEPLGFRGREGRAELTSVRACTTGTTSGCL